MRSSGSPPPPSTARISSGCPSPNPTDPNHTERRLMTGTITPVTCTIHVRCDAETAFRVFTPGDRDLVAARVPRDPPRRRPRDRLGGAPRWRGLRGLDRGRAGALGRRHRLGSATRARSRVEGQPRGARRDRRRGHVHARGRWDARRPRACGLGAARRRRRRGPRELRRRLAGRARGARRTARVAVRSRRGRARREARPRGGSRAARRGRAGRSGPRSRRGSPRASTTGSR